MEKYYLEPTNKQKSFYKKAQVIIEDNGSIKLQSYDTIVAKIENGKFVRLWNDYSATTLTHINSFLQIYGYDTINKKIWCDMEVANN